MQSLQRIFETITRQLGGFSPVAKLLIGALATILVMSLVLVAVLTGSADMAPLGLRSGVSEDVRARVVSHLETSGVQYETRGQDIWVPADDRLAVLGRLSENETISGDQIDFDSMLKDDSPFVDRETRRMRELVARRNEVQGMLGSWRGIRWAKVVYDRPTRPPGFGATHAEPTASVTVMPASGELESKTADAIARFVAGSLADLRLQNVTVIDARTSEAVRIRSDEDYQGDLYLELATKHERRLGEKIRDALGYVPDVIVAVTAVVDADRSVEERQAFDDPKQGVTRENQSEYSSTQAQRQAEPGVRPNVQVQIAAGAERTTETRRTDARTDLVPRFGSTVVRTTRAGGEPLRYNVSVSVPREYLAGLWQKDNPQATAEPADGDLQPYLAPIESTVRTLIDVADAQGGDAGSVYVGMFTRVAGLGLGTLGEGSGGDGGGLAGGLVGEGVIRTASLALLAGASLFLMLMVVRRASREEEMPSAEELVGIPPALAQAESDLVGEADESDAAMEGVEIDEAQVRRTQMLDQINDLARNAPDDAATLVRKWLRQDEP